MSIVLDIEDEAGKRHILMPPTPQTQDMQALHEQGGVAELKCGAETGLSVLKGALPSPFATG